MNDSNLVPFLGTGLLFGAKFVILIIMMIMDVISMKKTISMLILCLLIVATLCSCGEQPLTMETESVKKIALTSNVGGNITLEKEEDVTAILLALQNASCVTCSTKQEALPQEQFRFTTYNANDEVMHTMVLYSNEYLQVDTALYKGNLADLQTLLTNFSKAGTLQDLSSVFSAKPQDITEIAFYNNTDKTFKMVTLQNDIQTILSPLQALKISQKGVSGKISSQITLYVRLKDTAQYSPAIELTRYESGTICRVGGKSAQVTNYNWDVLYSKLPYNTMPIK